MVTAWWRVIVFVPGLQLGLSANNALKLPVSFAIDGFTPAQGYSLHVIRRWHDTVCTVLHGLFSSCVFLMGCVMSPMPLLPDKVAWYIPYWIRRVGSFCYLESFIVCFQLCSPWNGALAIALGLWCSAVWCHCCIFVYAALWSHKDIDTAWVLWAHYYWNLHEPPFFKWYLMVLKCDQPEQVLVPQKCHYSKNFPGAWVLSSAVFATGNGYL